MPRPRKCRRVCSVPKNNEFAPIGMRSKSDENFIIMSVDEYEAIRLIDFENLKQEQCAVQMNIARTTVTGIYDNARKKLADVLVNGKKLIIGGGDFTICESAGNCCGRCGGSCDGCQKKCYKKLEE